MPRHPKRVPAWVLGLIIATLLFVVVLVVSNALGFGDDPVVETSRVFGSDLW